MYRPDMTGWTESQHRQYQVFHVGRPAVGQRQQTSAPRAKLQDHTRPAKKAWWNDPKDWRNT